MDDRRWSVLCNYWNRDLRAAQLQKKLFNGTGTYTFYYTYFFRFFFHFSCLSCVSDTLLFVYSHILKINYNHLLLAIAFIAPRYNIERFLFLLGKKIFGCKCSRKTFIVKPNRNKSNFQGEKPWSVFISFFFWNGVA